jgi:hypothetical protein
MTVKSITVDLIQLVGLKTFYAFSRGKNWLLYRENHAFTSRIQEVGRKTAILVITLIVVSSIAVPIIAVNGFTIPNFIFSLSALLILAVRISSFRTLLVFTEALFQFNLIDARILWIKDNTMLRFMFISKIVLLEYAFEASYYKAELTISIDEDEIFERNHYDIIVNDRFPHIPFIIEKTT